MYYNENEDHQQNSIKETKSENSEFAIKIENENEASIDGAENLKPLEVQLIECQTTADSTTTPLSRTPSNETLTNIPRRSRTSEQPQEPHTQSLPSSDVPTAANSRSFFLNRENIQKIPISPRKAESAVPGPPEPIPPTLFTPEQLATVIRLAVIESPTAAKVNLTRIPRNPLSVISDVDESNNSIFNAIHTKVEGILKLLNAPTRVDWKLTRRSIAEQHPICLLDSLVDLINFILTTQGIWNFDNIQQTSSLISQIDEISVLVSDLQRRLTFQYKARIAKLSPSQSPTNQATTKPSLLAHGFPNQVFQSDLIESLGRLTSCLSDLIRSSLEISINRNQSIHDPLISAITGKISGSSKTGGSPKALVPKLSRTLPRIGTSHEQQDHVRSFIKTVQTLMESDLCCRLFESPELRVSLNCLQGIRAGLIELAYQRIFEWNSMISQESLPHQLTTMPIDGLTAVTRKSIGIPIMKKVKDSENYHNVLKNRITSNCKNSLGIHEVQSLLGVRLVELSNAYRALYRFVGSILGGVHEFPEVQSELTDASVLGSYVTMVGFLFYNDLIDLAQWAAPLMSQIRRKIKQQTAAVNSIAASTPRCPSSDNQSSSMNHTNSEQPSPMSGGSTHASALQLSNLLASPQDICLTRLSESENILYFFLPHLRKTRNEGSQIGAPADRVNRVLIWLAWEGGLMNLYQTQQDRNNEGSKEAPTASPERGVTKKVSSPPSSCSLPSISLNVANETIEDAIINAIVEGCRIMKEKLSNALQLFDQTTNQSTTEWNGKGEDILEFCQRVIESVTLRYLGEVDLRNMKDIHGKSGQQQARWKSCLLKNLGRATLPSRASQVSTRVIEALPKLFGEYCHQSLFYSSPLHQDDLHSNALATAITSSTAATARLNGVTRDLDSRITKTQYLAESAVLNSHQNHHSIDDLSDKLKDLTSQFESQSQGVVDRHSNQIRTHTNRLEEHTTDIRRIQQLITSHQTRLELHTNEVKKFTEASAELRTEASETQKKIQEVARAHAESLENRVTSVEQLMQSTFSPYGETIERLKSTATILTESAKATKLEFRNIFSQVNQLQERVEECKTELEKHFEDRLETIKTETQEECDRLEQNNQAMRESILVLQEGIKDMMKGVAESVVSKSRGELSSYLTEHLSHCINNHVVYQLDRVLQQRQQTSSRRRLLAWASSMTTPTTSKPSSIGNNSGEMNSVSTSLLQHQAPFPSFSVSPNELTKAPSLIQSTHRTSHRCGIFTNPNDDLTSLADTSSVMEESCSIETPLAQSSSWFADLQLLDLPDPRSNNGRYTSNSFVINDHRNTKESGFNNESILSPHSGHTRFNTTEVSTTSFTNTNIPSFNHDERRNNEILQGTPKPQQKIANQSLNNQTGA